MEMPDLVEMLKTRQDNRSVEQFAHELGLTASYLYLIYNNKRGISISTIRKFAKYFGEHGDVEMVKALTTYAIGFDPAPSLS